MKWVLMIIGGPTGNKAYVFQTEDMAKKAQSGVNNYGQGQGTQTYVAPLEKP